MEKHNYYPELLIGTKLANGDEFTYRDDIKPLHIVQPEGVSFQLNGNQLTWQNWSLHIGFNYREGLVLNTIQYFDKDEGRVRPVIYRASLSEMVVPYAAPESPWIKKFAFDVGEYGLGMMANELALGWCGLCSPVRHLICIVLMDIIFYSFIVIV
jgi:primary-amine oxidase